MELLKKARIELINKEFEDKQKESMGDKDKQI